MEVIHFVRVNKENEIYKTIRVKDTYLADVFNTTSHCLKVEYDGTVPKLHRQLRMMFCSLTLNKNIMGLNVNFTNFAGFGLLGDFLYGNVTRFRKFSKNKKFVFEGKENEPERSRTPLRILALTGYQPREDIVSLDQHVADTLFESETPKRIDPLSLDDHPADIRRLCDGIARSKALRFIVFTGVHIGPETLRLLADAIKQNQTIKSVVLHHYRDRKTELALLKENTGLHYIAEALCENTSISELKITGWKYCKKDASALSKTFERNTALKWIGIGGNISISGFKQAERLTEMMTGLSKNSNVTEMSITHTEITAEMLTMLLFVKKDILSPFATNLIKLKFDGSHINESALEVLSDYTYYTERLSSLKLPHVRPSFRVFRPGVPPDNIALRNFISKLQHNSSIGNLYIKYGFQNISVLEAIVSVLCVNTTLKYIFQLGKMDTSGLRYSRNPTFWDDYNDMVDCISLNLRCNEIRNVTLFSVLYRRLNCLSPKTIRHKDIFGHKSAIIKYQ